MNWEYDRGGSTSTARNPRDCVARAIAIATQTPYQDVCMLIVQHASRERIGKRKRGKSTPGSGVYTATIRKVMASLGWVWTPTMGIGTGCQVHLRANELPPGRLVVSLSGHLTAVIDGVIHDLSDPSRGGARCVYGYWKAPA